MFKPVLSPAEIRETNEPKVLALVARAPCTMRYVRIQLGLTPDEASDILQALRKQGLVRHAHNLWSVTDKGRK